ncbi:MAG: division/cell wall cluster transcriptional repressor MraZ [Treponema porcinum]|uniref:division/cell wall cluster transcriptional repressor MraZ n=1 Tax=Treponema porcinum TaxID=261392 RepID=UPI0023546C26|nr:division/cell wall cluster transcriptional repressor MraZ [Treponema porcinum]MCI6180474.1 division/cell wall cluster transcriptional repressor MraZ [Treponema porcinum]MCI6983033.1 division/cell wall cluster transcriptional repressor MraZ [Treponema porcinum]MCI7546724.1 division/cell wall cluster transcriptional repressor MraZ [Treponema porcinum]MDY4189261.1 division/cell wall cluster transcriptional repressor MraZ [Treponema porcinum]MDY5047823.1 division/cell wall cluster transcription
MNLLTGEYRNTLDEKGRILFPTKLRTGMVGNVLVVTQAFDRCLWLFTPEEWENISSKLMENASPFNEKNRLVLRRFIAPAQEIEFDKSGRLSIPQSLREYASLSKDCVILGVNKYMELWDAESYKAYLTESEDSFRSAAEELNAISF